VEGYTDVISLFQSGVDNAVASSGTALTEEQIKLVKRFTDNITVLFDGDAAGIKAALRGVDMILSGGLNVRVVLLPDGEDPDSYSRKLGTTALKEYLVSHTRDFISFKIELLSREAHDPIRKAEAIRDIVTSISRIPDAIKRSVYIREASDLMGIAEPVLLSEMNKLLVADKRKRHEERTEPPVDSVVGTTEDVIAVSQPDSQRAIELQERESIRLLLNYAETAYEDRRLLDFMLTELEEVVFVNETYRTIYETFRSESEAGTVPEIFHFMEKGTEEVRKVVAELITPRYETSKYWSEKYHIYFPHEREMMDVVAYKNVLRMKYRHIKKMIETNLKDLKTASDASEQEKYFTIHEQLVSVQSEIAGMLGIVVPG
jgi:DNA primase